MPYLYRIAQTIAIIPFVVFVLALFSFSR